MKVWMSILRRGVAYHQIDGRKTLCGRFIGDPWGTQIDETVLGYTHGWVLGAIRAVDEYNAKPCKHCEGTAERVDPKAVPSRDRNV